MRHGFILNFRLLIRFQIRFVTRPDFNSLSFPSFHHSFVRLCCFVSSFFLFIFSYIGTLVNESVKNIPKKYFLNFRLLAHVEHMHWACVYRMQNWKLKWAFLSFQISAMILLSGSRYLYLNSCKLTWVQHNFHF